MHGLRVKELTVRRPAQLYRRELNRSVTVADPPLLHPQRRSEKTFQSSELVLQS